MSSLGPKEAAPLWDVASHVYDAAGHIYNAFAGPAKEVAKEVAEQGTTTVVEEIKQLVQGQSPLATTESLLSFGQNVSNNTSVSAAVPFVQEKLATYFDPSSTAVVPYNAAAEGTSYLGYAGYGLGALAAVGGSLLGLRKLFQAKKQAEGVLSAEARPVLEQAEGFLNTLDNLLKNDSVKAILKLLTAQQAQQLKALADTTPSFFADLAKLDPAVQVLQLNNAIKPTAAPVSSALPEDLSRVDLNEFAASLSPAAAASPVMGTQAEKAASKFGALVDRIMVSPEAKQLLAIIGNHEQATKVLGLMNENALKVLAHNAPKYAANPKVAGLEDAGVAKLLVGIAKLAEQIIELEATKKSALRA